MTFCELLALVIAEVRLRLANGEFTERQLARRIHLSQPQMHNVLKGARTLKPVVADRILLVLGVSLSELAPGYRAWLPAAPSTGEKCGSKRRARQTTRPRAAARSVGCLPG